MRFVVACLCVIVTSLLLGCQGNQTIDSIVDNGSEIFGHVSRFVDLPVGDLDQIEEVVDVVDEIPTSTESDNGVIQRISARSGVVEDPTSAMMQNRRDARALVESTMRQRREVSD